MQNAGQNACTEQVLAVIECIVFGALCVYIVHFTRCAQLWRAASDDEFFSSPILNNTISIISGKSIQKSGWYVLIHLKGCTVCPSTRFGQASVCPCPWPCPVHRCDIWTNTLLFVHSLMGRTTYDSRCSFVPHSTREANVCMKRSLYLTHSLD